jgi:pimeloyl-ACP methyl ester carboxylesterase
MARRWGFLAILLSAMLQPAQADVLVLVHGYMSDARTWDFSGVTPVLAANGWVPATVPATVSAETTENPAQPVATRSVATNKFLSVNLPAAAPLQVQAAQLAGQVAMLRQWYADERLVLAGHSAGGVVARMLVIGGNPFKVDTLISIAAPNLGTARAAQGLDVVDFKPFFCPGPGIEFLKSVLGGDEYDYLEHSRGALVDLLPAESGNILAWLNQQPHPDITYIAIVRGSPNAAGDSIVPAYSQDLNNVPALHGRVTTLFTPAGHGLNPQDGQLLADLLQSAVASKSSGNGTGSR